MSTFDDIADDEPPLDVPMPRINLSQQRFSMVSLNSLFRTSLLRTSTLMLTDPRCLDTMLALLQKATLELDCRMTFLLLPKENVQVVLDATQGVLDLLPQDHRFRRNVLYLLIKLVSTNNLLPSSFILRHVELGRNALSSYTGQDSDVYCGQLRGRKVAVKVIRAHEVENDEMNKVFIREALVWRQLEHPNILPFLGVDIETFAYSKRVGLISPWMKHGSLSDYLRSVRFNPEDDCDHLLQDIAAGLVYLHRQNMVHGDLHGSNVLIDADGKACLGDFGIVLVGEATFGRMSTTGGTHGSIRFMAPERIDPERQALRRKPGVDIYAFACLVYLVYTGRAPFHELALYEVCQAVVEGKRPSRPQAAECLAPLMDEAWLAIEACWHSDPMGRPSMAEVHQEILLWRAGKAAATLNAIAANARRRHHRQWSLVSGMVFTPQER